MTKNKYIEFKLLERKPKTSVYSVSNIKQVELDGLILGIIKWFPSWRQYCFFPEADCVFNIHCLNDIKEFIQDLMDERMVVKNDKK